MSRLERKSIPARTSTMLWIKAGGRCEYCNKPLWKDSLTQKDMNKAYISHIIAASSNGPRGHWHWSSKSEIELSNLLLLCDECHNRIDESQLEDHSVERLIIMKNEHEERIERLCGYKPERRSYIVIMGANIGEHIPTISLDKAVNAMLKQGYFPATDRPISLGIINSATKDSDSDYWTFNNTQLVRAFEKYVRPLMNEMSDVSFSIFGLAPQPLLVKLGVLFSDLQNVDIYQKHREPDTWDWLGREKPNEFISLCPEECSGDPILIFSISANAISERVRRKYSENCNIWEITATQVGNDMLKCKKQLSDFRMVARKMLDMIQSRNPNKVIKVFMAMPASCAIELGRVWMPKADLPMALYEHNTILGDDYETIIIKNE